MKNSTKHARKAKRRAAALARKQQAERKTEIIPGIFLQNIQMPRGSRQFLQDYYKQHPGDEWRPSTNMDIAMKAGATERVGTLLSCFYIIHSTQDMITGEVESIMDDFGLWIKGIRPAMNHVLQAEDEFFKIMTDTLDKSDDPEGSHNQYMRDFDSFYEKALRWMRLPKQWHPGEETKLPQTTEQDIKKAAKNGKLIVDTGWEEMKITTTTLPAETQAEWTDYSISKLYRDESAEVVKGKIPTLMGAKRMTMKLHRENPQETYVIYETHNARQETATLVPIIAITPNAVIDGKKMATTNANIKTKGKRETKG